MLDSLRAAIARHGGRAGAAGRLDRIRPRTACRSTAFVVAFYVLLPSSATSATGAELSEANWWWLAPMIAGAAATILFASLSFVASVPSDLVLPALRMQIASSFLSRIAPASTGTLAVGVRFLQRSGLDPGPAAADGAVRPGGVRRPRPSWAFLSGWVERRGLRAPRTDVIFIVITVVLSASGLAIGLVPAVAAGLASARG